MTRKLLLLLFALPLARPSASGAHAVGVSRGDYRVEGDRLHADLVFARPELATALPQIDADGDGELSRDEVAAAGAVLAAWLGAGLEVRTDTGRCTGGLETARPIEQDGVALASVYRCPREARSIVVRLGVLADLTLGHRHLATSASAHSMLYLGQPELALAMDASDARPSLFRLGLVRVFTGYGHLLFLLAVVLAGLRRRTLLVGVVAYALAQSLALAIAGLGMWTPPPALVAPGVALSIAYLGIENCLARDARRRWRRTFAFGLVHGFAFAGVLGTVATSAATRPRALASFHLGIEAGQLAAAVAMLAMLSWLGRRAWVVRGGNVALAAIGVGWLVASVAG